jgi:hypothetical protein
MATITQARALAGAHKRLVPRGVLALLVLGVAGAAVTAPAASARSLHWSAGRARSAGDLIGVACPARTLCVAVDNAGKVVVSGRPSGGPKTWRVVSGVTVLQAGGTLKQQTDAARIDQEANDVSCPSVHLCVLGRPGASSRPGGAPEVFPVASVVYTTNPLGGKSAWHTVNGIDRNAGLVGSISCPSVHLCFALENRTDQYGNGRAVLLESTDPTGPANAWRVTSAEVGDYFQGLSCPSTALCVAGGGGGLWWTTHPAGPSATWSYVHLDTGQVDAVSCPSTGLCLGQPDMAGCKPCGAGNDVLSARPTTGAWRQAAVATGFITCKTTSFCVGVAFPDISVQVSTQPTGDRRAWQLTRIAKSSAYLRAVACASTSFCVAVGDRGSVAVGQ